MATPPPSPPALSNAACSPRIRGVPLSCAPAKATASASERCVRYENWVIASPTLRGWKLPAEADVADRNTPPSLPTHTLVGSCVVPAALSPYAITWTSECTFIPTHVGSNHGVPVLAGLNGKTK